MHELRCAQYITSLLLKQGKCKDIVWYHPTCSPRRVIQMTTDIRERVFTVFPPAPRHRFWEFHCVHTGGTNPESLQRKDVEYDFFAYDGQESQRTETILDYSKPEAWLTKPSEESRQDSPETETRKAVIFEVTQSGNARAKIAQLELQLAVFLAKREVKTCRVLKVTDVVACAGVCIPKVCIPEIENLLSSPICKEFLPHIFALRDAKCIEVLPSDEEMTHAPPPTPTPRDAHTNTFWVQLINVTDDPTQHSKAVAFQATPVIANIDGLKKAVQKERKDAGQTIDPLMLKVYAHDATGAWVEVTEPWAPLAANTGETAYHVLVP